MKKKKPTVKKKSNLNPVDPMRIADEAVTMVKVLNTCIETSVWPCKDSPAHKRALEIVEAWKKVGYEEE
jgi:hypothetical protein